MLRTFARDWQAQIVKGLLEDAGIHAVITGENIFRALPHSGDPNGVKLEVWKHDLEDAKRILDELPLTEAEKA